MASLSESAHSKTFIVDCLDSLSHKPEQCMQLFCCMLVLGLKWSDMIIVWPYIHETLKLNCLIASIRIVDMSQTSSHFNLIYCNRSANSDLDLLALLKIKYGGRFAKGVEHAHLPKAWYTLLKSTGGDFVLTV